MSSGAAAAKAVEENTAIKSQRVVLFLGSESNQKRLFYPDGLIFEKGKSYTLVIENPSNEIHEFDAPGLAATSKSSQVKVLVGYGGTALPVATVVGKPDEMIVNSGGSVEWTFIPAKAGTYEMICDVLDKSGKTHTELGMKGMIVVK